METCPDSKNIRAQAGDVRALTEKSLVTIYNDYLNELTSSSITGTGITYGYDPNRNLANRTVTSRGTTTWTYSWDSAGRLLKVTNGTPQGTYAYDGLGRRAESVESSPIFYSYSGTETLSETPSSGTETDYIRAGGMMIAKVTGSTIYYYHLDALGSTRLVTNSRARVGVSFADNYLPFGQDNGTPTGSETYKFTGKPVSATTGLYYYYTARMILQRNGLLAAERFLFARLPASMFRSEFFKGSWRRFLNT